VTPLRWLATAVLLLLCVGREPIAAQTTDTITVRGQRQTVRLYGAPGGDPVIVSSGDGGWIHLAPQVAELLAARGFFVVGFDAKAYLSSFTSARTTLRPEDAAADYAALADFAIRTSGKRAVLIGVSEGAGLSVLAASDRQTHPKLAGVVALGLPDSNELGWRLRDSLIYLTHGAPHEPTFSTAAIVERMAPVPLAVIHSTKDEFVPREEMQRVFDAAREPKRLWMVEASNHRFSDNAAGLARSLVEAMQWVSERTPR